VRLPRFVACFVASFVAFVVLASGCFAQPSAATPKPTRTPRPTTSPLPQEAPPQSAPADEHTEHTEHDEHADEDDGKDHRALFVDRIPIGERNAVVDVAGLIESRGPFKYPQDGSVFQNREKRLPKQKPGFWHEYTVDTPGESDRGARRLIAGDDGSLYYTRDHYETFVVLREPR